jgi:hypothetical protein
MLLSADPNAVFDSPPSPNQRRVEIDLFVEDVVAKLSDLTVEYIAEEDRVIQRKEGFYVMITGGDDVRTVVFCYTPREIVPGQTALYRVTNDREE